MQLRLKTNTDVCKFALAISVFATLISELAVFTLYWVAGPDAFGFHSAILFAGIVPLLISMPISLYTGRQSMAICLAEERYRKLSQIDPLTDLPNRRSWFANAEETLEIAAAAQGPCALLIIDADYFKDLNDNYGHSTGDLALESIAAILRSNFRQGDLISRVGGEEFAVLLPGIDAHSAEPLAERVLKAVANSPVTAGNSIVEFSVSCGIADTRSGYEMATLFKAADDALYQAKHNGLNQVFLQAA